MRLSLVLAALVPLFGVPAAQARAQAGGDIARILVMRPHEGGEQAFEEGYRRHLEWHRAQSDPWTWWGWQFVTGERVGDFMDGTFGHTWAALDAAVAPAQDAADNAANVLPHARITSNGAWRLHEAWSRGRFLEEGRASPLLEMVTIEVVPGGGGDFAALAPWIHGALEADHALYERVNGGAGGTWVLLIPRGSISALEGAVRSLDSLLAGSLSGEALARARELLRRSVASERTELLRYRPDLSYRP